jgi:hypothetical protein
MGDKEIRYTFANNGYLTVSYYVNGKGIQKMSYSNSGTYVTSIRKSLGKAGSLNGRTVIVPIIEAGTPEYITRSMRLKRRQTLALSLFTSYVKDDEFYNKGGESYSRADIEAVYIDLAIRYGKLVIGGKNG